MQDQINALGGADVRRTYMTIGKGGTFRLQVEKGTKDAKTRSYEVEVDGVKVTKEKTEIHKSLLKDVTIKNISVYNGNYGESINVDVLINGTEFTLQFKADSSFGMDFMEKVPGIDLSKPLNIRGYDFEPEPGKRKRGLSIEQGGEKITGFFYDAEKKKSLHGIPTPVEGGKGYDSKKWRRFFEDKAEFLVAYMKSDIIPKLATVTASEPTAEVDEATPDDVAPEDIPF